MNAAAFNFDKTNEVEEGKQNPILIKSQNDYMDYRLIELDNGLRAILISDVTQIVDLNDLKDNSSEEYSEEEYSSNSDDENVINPEIGAEKMAACALCVGVGSFSDPPDIPGLAHFLEHMVFMGSEKYPQENGFDEFIKKHGGSDNGSTECETTTFYLECNEKYLKECMDRFAQFFISPLMIEEAMTREREIIHSEFEMSLPSDETRKEQILGSLAPRYHPAAKFLWGNITTLRDNIDDKILYKRVHEFQKRHYSAHRMTVAVQARLPLDTLEEYVINSFSDIPNNNLPPDNFSSFIGSYGTTDTFNKLVWIKPVKDVCQVHLTWVLPSYMKNYKSRPLDYIGWLMGHEGKGSLLALLRKRVWALDCEAGNDESGFEHNSIYSLFSVSLNLTAHGYAALNEVIKLVFSYITMLIENCPSKDVFDELRTVSDTNFRYKAEIPSASYVEILAESMQMYEPQHYIAGGELYLEYEPEVITEVIGKLTPDKVNVIVYSKEKTDDFYNKVEPWFQTKYRIEEIPSDWKNDWFNCPSLPEFHLPNPNPYLIQDFSLLPNPESCSPYPVKIIDDELLEIWYRQDDKFREPLAYFCFYLMSPMIKEDPFNAVLLDVLTAYLETKLPQYTFPANQAGLYFSFSPADFGFYLQFNGYSEKLPLLFDEILKLLLKFCSKINNKSNELLFDAVKKERSRAFYNTFLKPKRLVRMARLSILVDRYWTALEYLAVMNKITLEKLYEFSQKIFKEIKVLGLIQGNFSKEDSLVLCGKFDSILHCTPLIGNKPQILVTKLNEGEIFLRLKTFNESDSNSVITNYYQIGPSDNKTCCYIDLIMMIMEEPLFDNLRTKQQIGYDVHCLLRDTFGILGFSITVFFQASKFEADEVDERIEAFLQKFLQILKSMPKKEWEELKMSLISLKSIADLKLEDEVKRNFSEICTNEYMFNRTKQELEIIPKITHEEVYNWLVDHVASGKKFRKLSVQVVGKSGNTPDTDTDTDSTNDVFEDQIYQFKVLSSDNEAKKELFITDIEDYKKTRNFYPPHTAPA